MVGDFQGNSEISQNSAEEVPQALKKLKSCTAFDRFAGPIWKQHGQTSVCGTNACEALTSKIELWQSVRPRK
jgi:hypothetical protein